MKKFTIALQLYSVREELEADFKGTLTKVKEMGYDGVEFAGLYGHGAKEIKSITDALGLVPVSAHVPIVEMLEDPEGVMDTYRSIGCKYIAIPWLDEKRRPGFEEYERTVKDIGHLTEAARKLGLQMVYHNHDFEFVKIDGIYALDALYDALPGLYTELDTCWIAVAGEDPAYYVEKYSGRAPIVHLKDFYLSGKKPEKMYELIGVESDDKEEAGKFEFRSLGQGVQDFTKILKSAETAGSEWVVIEQDMPSEGKTPMECAKISIDYLKSL